eukprot:2203229-Rhodomonas_salina.2
MGKSHTDLLVLCHRDGHRHKQTCLLDSGVGCLYIGQRPALMGPSIRYKNPRSETRNHNATLHRKGGFSDGSAIRYVSPGHHVAQA